MNRSYLESLLATRKINTADFNYLWELHLTDNEYSTLKEILREDALDGRFYDTKAAALYFSEWWRREFNGGRVGTDDPCRDLLGNTNLNDQLYLAAQRGARELDLQVITTRGEQREMRNTMYSLFYQGGLPMNYIVKGILANHNSGWITFIKKLVWNQQDFNEVDGGEIAAQSDSMQHFCDKLRLAADIQDPSLQPYHHNELWWNIVVRQFEESKRERRARTPFEISWIFRFDHREKKIKVGAKISGQSTLSDNFVNDNGLNGRDFTTISVLLRDRNIYTAEYDQRFYCRKSAELKFEYNLGDTITISLNNGEKILSQKALDLETPKLLFCKDDDETIFFIGEPHHLQNNRCIIIASNDWEATCDNIKPIGKFEICGQSVIVFEISNTGNVVTLKNKIDNEIKRFSHTIGIRKTFIDYGRAISLEMPIKEHTFNGDYLGFYEGDENSSRLVPNERISFSPKGERNWTNTPSLGAIKARVQIEDNEYSEPVHFINSGRLEINVIESAHDKCVFQVRWESGSISSEQAVKEDQHWTINRRDLIRNRYCILKFNPRDGLGAEFQLTLMPPFHDFCIFDQHDNKIETGATIPLIDINNYRYYIYGDRTYTMRFDRDQDDYFNYSIGNAGFMISEILCKQTAKTRMIAHEGSLGSLFLGGSEQIEQRINNSCLSLPFVKTEVWVMNSCYTIKPFPLRLACTDNRVAIINSTQTLRYNGNLKAIPFDEPGLAPVELTKTADGKYHVPEEILKSPYGHWLIYGDRQGYILPISIKTQEQENNLETDNNSREATRADKLSEIKEHLLNEPMFSESWQKALKWYKMLPQGYIPGTSVLELVAIADEWTLPVKLALHLWAEALCATSCVKESLDSLKGSLNEFSKQMSFLWRWCKTPSKEEFHQYAEELFKNDNISLDKCYFGWILTLSTEDIRNNPDLLYPNIDILHLVFSQWLNQIYEENQPILALRHPDLNNHGDGLRSNDAREYFLNKTNEFQCGNLPKNDRWITVRRRCHRLLETQNFGNLPGDEHIRREIRQSIINGLRYMTLDEIDNQLRRRRN